MFEQELKDAADYADVLSTPGRPAISDPEIRTLDSMASHLLNSLSEVGGDLLIADSHDADSAAESRQHDKLHVIATAYRADAKRERSLTYVFFLGAAVTIASSIGFIFWGLLQATPKFSTYSNTAGASVWDIFAMYLVASLVSLVASVIIVAQGERHRRADQEATRLARQFDAIESYLNPIPQPLRDVVRVSLTPRLFSRILWDDDPMREPTWPTASEIIEVSTSARHRSQ